MCGGGGGGGGRCIVDQYGMVYESDFIRVLYIFE